MLKNDLITGKCENNYEIVYYCISNNSFSSRTGVTVTDVAIGYGVAHGSCIDSLVCFGFSVFIPVLM